MEMQEAIGRLEELIIDACLEQDQLESARQNESISEARQRVERSMRLASYRQGLETAMSLLTDESTMAIRKRTFSKANANDNS